MWHITWQGEVRLGGGLRAVFQLPLCTEAAWAHLSGWGKHSILRCGSGMQRSQCGKCCKPQAVPTDFEDCAMSPHNAQHLPEAGKGQKQILLRASSQGQRLLGTQTAASNPRFELLTSRVLGNKSVLFLAIGFWLFVAASVGS